MGASAAPVAPFVIYTKKIKMVALESSHEHSLFEKSFQNRINIKTAIVIQNSYNTTGIHHRALVRACIECITRGQVGG